MDSASIETRRFFTKIRIHLLDDKIEIIESGAFESKEFELSYEQIEAKRTVETKVSFGLLTFSMLLFVTSVFYAFGVYTNVALVLFSFSVLLIMIALLTKLRVVTIRAYGEQNIELFFNIGNKDEIIKFSDQIIESTNTNILKKYSRIDRDLPVENQLEKLDLLRSRDLITEEKFEELKSQLLGRDSRHSIGYR